MTIPLALLAPLLTCYLYYSYKHFQTRTSSSLTNSRFEPLRKPDTFVPSDVSLSQASIRIDTHAKSYEIFILHRNCTTRSRRRVCRTLQTRFKCSHCVQLPKFGYIQARCDGLKGVSPHQVGEMAVARIRCIKRYVDNMEMPSSSRGEEVLRNTLSSRKHKHGTERLWSARFVQQIQGDLPWGLDRMSSC